MDEWLPTPEELSAPLHKAAVRKESGWRLCPAHPQLLGEKAAPGPLVLLVSAREGGGRGSEGREKAGSGMGQARGQAHGISPSVRSAVKPMWR